MIGRAEKDNQERNVLNRYRVWPRPALKICIPHQLQLLNQEFTFAPEPGKDKLQLTSAFNSKNSAWLFGHDSYSAADLLSFRFPLVSFYLKKHPSVFSLLTLEIKPASAFSPDRKKLTFCWPITERTNLNLKHFKYLKEVYDV